MDGKCAQLAALLPSAQEGALITSEHNRRYLTGFRSSAGAVLVTQAEAYFLTDFRYIEAAGQRVRGAQCLCYRRLTDTLAELVAGSCYGMWRSDIHNCRSTFKIRKQEG